MAEFLLFTHSWLRWIILILAVYVILKSFRGWRGNKMYTSSDNRLAVSFLGLFHLQVLLGLIMYFFTSTITETALNDFGAAMKNSGLRYWAVEHITIMLAAAVFVQIGRIKSKKAKSNMRKHKFIAIFYLIGLILVLMRIPWNEAGRLFRGL